MKSQKSTQPHGERPDTTRQPSNDQRARDFHGASVIDENGVEIPIDERMVQDALDALDAVWTEARQRCRRSKRG